MNFEERIHQVISREMENTESEAVRFLTKIQAKPKLCLWGLGSHGRLWYAYLKKLNISIDYVFDNSSQALAQWCGEEKKLTRQEFEEHLPEMTVVVAMRNAQPSVDELRSLGFYDTYVTTLNIFCFDTSRRYSGHPAQLREMEQHLYEVLALCADDPSREIICQTVEKWFDEANVNIDCIEDGYFVQPIISLSEEEIFVDAGAYDGDTIADFLRMTDGKYCHIYAFEMVEETRAHLLCRVQEDPRYDIKRTTVFPYGLLDKNVTLHYNGQGMAAVIDESGEGIAEFRSLDEVLEGKPVTFIKMDIEGAEPEALRGAERTIRRCSPKLAICTYHKAEHLWEIPFYIRGINPEYKFYFRHHTMEESDTVCYAVL